VVETSPSRPDGATALCTDCALCCSGALFDTVPVAEADVAAVAALGLDVVRRQTDLVFRQPCAMLRGRLCSVYEGRPPACRRFRCTLLERYEEGAVGLAEARETIAKGKSLIGQARAVFAAGESDAGARQRWKRGLAANAAPEAARFHLLMTALNRFLDRHFRPEAQHQVVNAAKDAARPARR
jgi:Fe-S-cluster containining protein